MTDLLGIGIGEEKPLDAGLMFGEKKAKFAVCDEKSIRIRLDRAMDEYMTKNGGIAWFSQWFGTAYPLRQAMRKELYSVMPSGPGKIDYLVYQYQLKDNRLAQSWIRIGKDCADVDLDRRERAWLSPSVGDLAAWVKEKLGRKIECDDMSFRTFGDPEFRSGRADGLRLEWSGVWVR